MGYLEVSIKIVDPAVTELLIARLSLFGYDSFTEEPPLLKAYIDREQFEENTLRKILLELLPDERTEFICSEIPDKNWNEIWEENYDPVMVDNHVIVRAPFHPTASEFDHEIIIKPQMAFGTGHHETTYLMMKIMPEYDFAGKSVLDMGSGSGVLAIFANKLGAKSVIAVDNDEWAYNNAQSNIELNQADNIKVVLGDKNSLRDLSVDIVIANINRNILLDQIPVYKSILNNGGMLFMSGIYEGDLEIIDQKCSESNLYRRTNLEKNEWVAALFMEGQQD